MSEINTVESIESGIPRISLQVRAMQLAQVPVDDTLSIEGEAADAKAVGDALAGKVDSTDYAALNVNGEVIDTETNTITVYGSDIALSNAEGADTIDEAISAINDTLDGVNDDLSELDGKTANDILYVSGGSTIKAVVDALPASVFDAVYPVGSIFSTSATQPPSRGEWDEILIQSTWEQLNTGNRSYVSGTGTVATGIIHSFRRIS